jgi:hypothetical protein
MEGVQLRRTESFEVIIFHRGEASLKAATVVGTIYGQFIRYLSLREYVDRIMRKKFITRQKFSRFFRQSESSSHTAMVTTLKFGGLDFNTNQKQDLENMEVRY